MSSGQEAFSAVKYRFKDLELDVGRRELNRDGAPIKLPKLSFRVLEVLVEAAPDLVSHDELIDRAWGENRVVTPENISQRIKMLRESLGDDAQAPSYIESVHGQGFRLIPEVISDAAAEVADAPGAQTGESERALSGRRMGLGLALVVLLVVAAWFFDFWPDDYDRNAREAEAGVPASIAVLPFANLSPDPDNSIYAAGIHDEVLNHLVQLTDLRVISRTSMLRYKDTEKPITRIAKELEVDSVIEGSVRYSNNRIRVTVQLVDGGTDEHLWSETYDRELQDIFEIESSIAREVAMTLRTLVRDEAMMRLEKAPTANLDAHVEYMRGREKIALRNPHDLHKAAEHFKRATELDPNYALAWVGVADSSSLIMDYAAHDPEEMMARLQDASERALQLDPGLAEAWLARAALERHRGNYEEAEQYFLRSIAMKPGYSQGYHWYGYFLFTFLERYDEALVQLRKGARLDPLNPPLNGMLGRALWQQGNAEEAIATHRRLSELNPDYHLSRWQLSVYIGQLGKLDAAAFWAKEAAAIVPLSFGLRYGECNALLALAAIEEARRCWDGLRATFPEDPRVIAWPDLLLFENNTEGLVAVLTALVEAYPASDLAQRQLAMAHMSNANLDAARSILTRLFPEYFSDAELEKAKLNLEFAVYAGVILRFASEPDLERSDYLFNASLAKMDSMHRLRGLGYGILDVLIHAARDDRSAAIQSLRVAIDEGWLREWSALRSVLFTQLNQEAEWQALQEEIQLAVTAQRENFLRHREDKEYWQ